MLASHECCGALANLVAELLQLDLIAFGSGYLTGHLTTCVSEAHGFVLLGCFSEAGSCNFIEPVWLRYGRKLKKLSGCFLASDRRTEKVGRGAAGQQILGPQRELASRGGRFFGANRNSGHPQRGLFMENNVSGMDAGLEKFQTEMLTYPDRKE